MKSAEVTLLGNSDQPAAEQQHQYSRQEVVEILTRYRRDLGKAVKARAGEQVSLSVVEMLELIETQAPSFD